MKALFQTQIRYDLEGHPLMLYSMVQEKPGDPQREMATTLGAERDGWVDAKQLVATLRKIAEVLEKELT